MSWSSGALWYLRSAAVRSLGVAAADIVIGEDGHVQTEAVDGNPLLASTAEDAVKQWVHQPTLLNGEPISVATTVIVPFSLK